MAETVKKSRIVSDDDLEESLIQEFNMRLKHCMSQEQVQDPSEDEEEKAKATIKMEFNNGVTTNGNQEESIYEEITPLSSSERFIYAERNLYTNLHQQQPMKNGLGEEHREPPPQEVIYDEVKAVRPVLQLPTTCLTDMSDSVDQDSVEVKSSVKDRMFLSTDDTSCLLFTQTVTSPMLTPSEENIDFLKGFQRQSSQTNTNSTSENSEHVASSSKAEDSEQAEEESSNISDKLDVNTETDVSEVDNAAPVIIEQCLIVQQENVYEGIEDETNDDKQEEIYENMEILRKQSIELLADKQRSTKEFLEKEIMEEDKFRSVGDNNYEDIEYTEEEDIELSNAESVEDLQKDIQNIDDQPQLQQETSRHTEILQSPEDLTRIPPTTTSQSKMPDEESPIFDSDLEDKSLDNPSKMVDALKSKFLTNASALVTTETPKPAKSFEEEELSQLKTVDIMKQINKFESGSPGREDADEEEYSSSSTEMTESTYVESTTTIETSSSSVQDKSLKKKKSKKSRSHDKENISVKSSFNKFDALQKKNVLHVRSSDSSSAQEKFNGAAAIDNTNCKACGKVVFQMEQIKAEKSVWHKNCFRCQECSKQLTVDTYQSNEGTVYCKPHFKSLFAPKAVEDDAPPSDKPDLGLEELQSLNVRERFQVFEHHEEQQNSSLERGQVNVKRSPSILSKLAKFQSKGMDVGVTDDSLNGIPIEESSSENEEEEEEIEGEDADLIRAKRAQKEKPFHFTGMSDVKSKWEHGEQNSKDVRREERKQEIQSIRDRLFMGKQGKMKEAYQQAVMESESCTNIRKMTSSPPPAEVCDTRTLKEKFEKGEAYDEHRRESKDAEDMSVFDSGISKKSRSIFLELDANAAKAPQVSPVSPPRTTGNEVRKAREAFVAKQATEDTIKSSEQIDDVKVETSDIQQRFKFFETYREPETKRKVFRITPPREGQVKTESPEREVYRDPDIVRAEEQIEDSIIAKETHTATKVLNKFRQMEENLNREPLNLGPKPLKRFTPPPEPARTTASGSESDGTESEDESESLEEIDQSKVQDADLVEAQKAARARQLRAKFEKWEAKEIKREQQQVNIIEEMGEEQQGQIESTKALRARFESLKESQSQVKSAPKIKVNRFV